MKPKVAVDIAFFEVEAWEKEYLAKALPDKKLTFFPGVLSNRKVNQVTEAPILSVFINSRLDRDMLDRLPNLRMIATRSTGYDHIDLAACGERGITVCNVPRYGETSVAEHTFGLILALTRHILKSHLRSTTGHFTIEELRGSDLKGKTIGVVGAGSIGLHVIRIAKGFGMNALAFDPHRDELIAEVLGFTYVPFEELLTRSDIVSLHAPYSPRTHHLISRESLKLMKKGAILINTARGGLVDTEDLLWALDAGIIGGAGLDVIEGEELIKEERQLLTAPAAEDQLRMVLRRHILMRREDVVITPHIAFNTKEALQRILETTVDNIRGFLADSPQNMVNPSAPSAARKAA
ncbi:MAG: hydroxyacid dehydrogenase [Chloroflexi bacterium]|nr:hydroxyacid dehydrogenase [Chloroflexota bacterium]